MKRNLILCCVLVAFSQLSICRDVNNQMELLGSYHTLVEQAYKENVSVYYYLPKGVFFAYERKNENEISYQLTKYISLNFLVKLPITFHGYLFSYE